jgi:enoyl-CoA hydratase/carnithine racemase
VSRRPEAPLVAARTEARVCVLTLRREAELNALSTALEKALAEALARDEVRNAAVSC